MNPLSKEKLSKKIKDRWGGRLKNNEFKLTILSGINFTVTPLLTHFISMLFFNDTSDDELKSKGNNVFRDLTSKDTHINISEIPKIDEILNLTEEWELKSYLKENGNFYNLSKIVDLDKASVRKHGDLSAIRNGRNINIEIEKIESNFIKHHHKPRSVLSNSLADDEEIDLLFAFPSKKRVNAPIEVEYFDVQHFYNWWLDKNHRRNLTSTLFLVTYEVLKRKHNLQKFDMFSCCQCKNDSHCIFPHCEKCPYFDEIRDLDSRVGEKIKLVTKLYDILSQGIVHSEYKESKNFNEFVSWCSGRINIKRR